jgi:hypothetical protein
MSSYTEPCLKEYKADDNESESSQEGVQIGRARPMFD